LVKVPNTKVVPNIQFHLHENCHIFLKFLSIFPKNFISAYLKNSFKKGNFLLGPLLPVPAQTAAQAGPCCLPLLMPLPGGPQHPHGPTCQPPPLSRVGPANPTCVPLRPFTRGAATHVSATRFPSHSTHRQLGPPRQPPPPFPNFPQHLPCSGHAPSPA
jgi:hypothetical protein